MSWRTIVVTRCSKLDLRCNNLLIRAGQLREAVCLDEIKTLILETTQISITAALMAKMAEKKIRVIICDVKHNPVAELYPYYGCHDCSKKIRIQMSWTDDIKALAWQQIVREKIKNQRHLLMAQTDLKYSINLLKEYEKTVEPGDATNREGLAAKVYFEALFGRKFRRASETVINAALNYGYQILLSSCNQAVKACGYLTEIGIFHTSQHNYFNLSSDLMEPLRPLVDDIVYRNQLDVFGTEEKRMMQSLLFREVMFDGRKQVLESIMVRYVKSVFDALQEHQLELVKFIEYEL